MNAWETVPVIDLLLGATAEAHGLVPVACNVKDIERSGVRCINPIDAAAGK